LGRPRAKARLGMLGCLTLPMKLAPLTALLLASACATSAKAPTAATGSPTPAAPGVTATATTDAMSMVDHDTAGDDLLDKPAPDFTAIAQDGTPVHLAALRGKAVVVYFYPKDETPGCTKEACSFRDAWQPIAKSGAILIGISADSRESHRDFVQHYNLPFLLLSDPDGSIGKSYGVPFAGRHKRQTIVIGANGNVRKVYRTVNVSEHAAQILDDLREAEHAR
jgi:peroxiredoxin Q/BCP